MKKLITICFTILFSLGAYSQSNDDVEIIQDIWGLEKKEIISKYMKLTDGEATAFWEDYSTYESSRKELGKERLAILDEYANNYETLSDEMASDLIKRGIANDQDISKLIKKTFKSMSKSIPPKQAALFVQLENYFLIVTKMVIQENIFFIGELDDLIIEE